MLFISYLKNTVHGPLPVPFELRNVFNLLKDKANSIIMQEVALNDLQWEDDPDFFPNEDCKSASILPRFFRFRSVEHCSTITITLVRGRTKQPWGIQIVECGEGCMVRKVSDNIKDLTVRGMNLGMLQKDDIILSITNESNRSVETPQVSEFSSPVWFSDVVEMFNCSHTLHMKVLRKYL